MKIIDAFWEKRNLGVTCNEVILEKDDSIAEVSNLNSLCSEYQVVKMPVERSDLIFEIQDLGFNFVEIIFGSSHNLILPELSPPLKRVKNAIDCREADVNQIENIKEKILSGMFKTDRIAIDPYFGLEKSAKRYVGWLSDEIDNGGYVYELYYKDRAVGFFVLKCEGDACDARIGGVYTESNVLGLGVLLNYFEIEVARNLKCSVLHGAFSSNNPSVFNINDILGYSTRPAFNVFVKHNFSSVS